MLVYVIEHIRWLSLKTSVWCIKNGWLIWHFVLLYTGQIYHWKALIIQIHTWACSRRRITKERAPSDFWAQTASDRYFLLLTFLKFEIWPSWPELDLNLNIKCWKLLHTTQWTQQLNFQAKVDQEIWISWHICDFKIIVTFCDLSLTSKCTKYRVSALILLSVCSWE